MKILLDNAGGTSDNNECSTTSTKTVRPSEIDIISIDSNEFLPQNFHSTRTPNKEVMIACLVRKYIMIACLISNNDCLLG